MLVGDPPDLCVAYPGRAEVRGVSMGNFHDCGAAKCGAVVLCVHERRLRRPPPSARAYVEGMSAARAHRQSLANGSGRGEKL